MKRTVLLFFSVLAMLPALSQGLSLNTGKVYLYGVDFSEVRVAGAYETNDYFVRAFVGINGLFVAEPKKYDFSKTLGVPVEPCIQVMTKITREMDTSSMRTETPEISPAKTEDMIAGYTLPQENGVGMILIARLLDKHEGEGTFDVVLFDIATRKPLFVKRVTKEASGNGLRNYWANAVYDIVRDKKLFR